MEFNINNYVQVKLTDRGRNEHKRQHNELLNTSPGIGPYRSPKEDAEGWSKWQAWDLISTFGHMIRMGIQLPFESTIRIDT